MGEHSFLVEPLIHILKCHFFNQHLLLKYINLSLFLIDFSCAEAILSTNPNQLLAVDPSYGGTPLHWAKTAEV